MAAAAPIMPRLFGRGALALVIAAYTVYSLNHVRFESGSSRGVGEAARIPI